MPESGQSLGGLSRARRHFLTGVDERRARLQQLAEKASGPGGRAALEEALRELQILRASARVFRMVEVEAAAVALITRLEREMGEVELLGSEVRDQLLDFALSLSSLIDGATEGARPRKSGPAAAQPMPSPRPRAPEVQSQPRDFSAQLPNTYVSVLVVGQHEFPNQIRSQLPAPSFEVITCSDTDTALSLARSQKPDVIIVEADAFGMSAARLWTGLSELGIPCVSLSASGAPSSGEGEVHHLAYPLESGALLQAIERATGLWGDDPLSPDDLGDVTLRTVTDRLVSEIERGLMEAADAGHDITVPMGEGTEILAAAWSAVAQVRALVSNRSGGKVRFRDPPSRSGPKLLSLGEVRADDTDLSEGELVGRRVVVADDDPAVRWFFTRLLQSAGAKVVPAAHGLEALNAARTLRPDLIVSDILMPEMDGLGLCRAIHRDPTLSEIPIILLSWKDDFLQQMRDLQAGAQEYLRKEEEEGQMLARMASVLKPRTSFERRLRAGQEVRGRIEGLGVGVIIRTVGAEKGDARVEFRNHVHQIRAELRGGQLVSVAALGRQGELVEGPAAVRALAGVNRGRFWVTEAGDTPLGRAADLPRLEESQAMLAAMLDAVEREKLERIRGLRLEAAFLGMTDSAERTRLEESLKGGVPPASLLATTNVTRQEVSELLTELIHRGACEKIAGPSGEDLGKFYLAMRAKIAHEEADTAGTVQELRAKPQTLLQWGRGGQEASTFVEYAEAVQLEEGGSDTEVVAVPILEPMELDEAVDTTVVTSLDFDDQTEVEFLDAEEGAKLVDISALAEDDPLSASVDEDAEDSFANLPLPEALGTEETIDSEAPESSGSEDSFEELDDEPGPWAEERVSWIGVAVAALILFVGGYAGVSAWNHGTQLGSDQALDEPQESNEMAAAPEGEQVGAEMEGAESPSEPAPIPQEIQPPAAPRVAVSETEGAIGQLFARAEGDAETVGTQGIVRVTNPDADGAEVRIALGERTLGTAPVEAVIEAGVYPVWFSWNDGDRELSAVRWVRIVTDHVRELSVPDGSGI